MNMGRAQSVTRHALVNQHSKTSTTDHCQRNKNTHQEIESEDRSLLIFYSTINISSNKKSISLFGIIAQKLRQMMQSEGEVVSYNVAITSKACCMLHLDLGSANLSCLLIPWILGIDRITFGPIRFQLNCCKGAAQVKTLTQLCPVILLALFFG